MLGDLALFFRLRATTGGYRRARRAPRSGWGALGRPDTHPGPGPSALDGRTVARRRRCRGCHSWCLGAIWPMLGDLALFFRLRATIGERMYGPKAAFMAAIPGRAGPIGLKTAPEHPWGHRTAVLP